MLQGLLPRDVFHNIKSSVSPFRQRIFCNKSLFFKIFECSGQHQLDSVKLVYFTCSGIEVDCDDVGFRVSSSQLLDYAFSYYMVRQAGKGLCADNVSCAAVDQFQHLAGQEPAFSGLISDGNDFGGHFCQILKLRGEVVSCDSMQIYRGMVIGTAAPTEEEMQGVPHHMVGVADPNENYSVARYACDAAKCVDELIARGKQPVIVGGTGLYLNALLAGHGFAGGDKDGAYRAELERRWEEEGGEAMFAALRRIDPETAANLHLNDKKRILRALEVYYETGKTMAQHNAETKRLPPRYDSVRIGLAYEDREDMKRAIDARVDKMVEAGLFDEVRALLASGLSRDVTAMQAIGYKEALSYLDGAATREEAIEEIKLRTRQYAKRQLTWLRRDKDIHWFYWKKTRDLPDCLAFSTEILRGHGVSCL